MEILTKKDLINYYKKNKGVTFSVDRFEENFAICENRKTTDMVSILRTLIPENVKSGDILEFHKKTLVVNNKKTTEEQESIKNLVNQLFKRKS